MYRDFSGGQGGKSITVRKSAWGKRIQRAWEGGEKKLKEGVKKGRSGLWGSIYKEGIEKKLFYDTVGPNVKGCKGLH